MNNDAFLVGYTEKTALDKEAVWPLLFAAGGTLLRVLSLLGGAYSGYQTVKETGSGIGSLAKGEGKAGAAHLGKAALNALGAFVGLGFGAPALGRLGQGALAVDKQGLGKAITKGGNKILNQGFNRWESSPAGAGFWSKAGNVPVQTVRTAGSIIDYPFSKAVGHTMRKAGPLIMKAEKATPGAGMLRTASRGLGRGLVGSEKILRSIPGVDFSQTMPVMAPYMIGTMSGLENKVRGSLDNTIDTSNVKQQIVALSKQGYSPRQIMHMIDQRVRSSGRS